MSSGGPGEDDCILGADQCRSSQQRRTGPGDVWSPTRWAPVRCGEPGPSGGRGAAASGDVLAEVASPGGRTRPMTRSTPPPVGADGTPAYPNFAGAGPTGWVIVPESSAGFDRGVGRGNDAGRSTPVDDHPGRHHVDGTPLRAFSARPERLRHTPSIGQWPRSMITVVMETEREPSGRET